MNNLAIKQVPTNTALMNVDASEFKRALKFVEPGMSKDETRYYLKGVYFDKQAGKPLYLVTTDGHRLHKIALGGEDNQAFTFLMPDTVAKQLIKTLLKTGTYTLAFGFDTLAITGGIENYVVNPIDGKFPDYQRVIPSGEDRAALAGYQACYLAAAFTSFAGLQAGKYSAVAVESFGAGDMGSPIKFVCTSEDALIVVMPLRV